MIISPFFMVFVGRSASIVYESGTTQAPAASTTTAAAVRYCGYCGNPLGPDDKFCGKCGRPVE
jgi:predicted amidophosphoribosyltransferase